VLFFYFVHQAIFSPNPNNLDRRFRIYRETLSRFSCAASRNSLTSFAEIAINYSSNISNCNNR
ncbi:hypothetical protein ACTMNS_06485, partial [Staphylococcus haemolyticus]